MILRPLFPALACVLLAACSPPQAETAEPPVAQVKQPVPIPAQTGFTLASPIACVIGRDCWIQQYADHDPTTGPAKDYTCGTAVYDGHDGTDFRLPDKAAQGRGVAVLAAADGVVLGARDGEPDWEVGAYDKAKVDPNRACGNGIVVQHPDGWQTQYCHLRKGSVAVAKGQSVKVGQSLGQVGQSGDAAFVHLHLTVRKDGKAIDPFGTDAGCNPDTARTLWRPDVQTQMAYRGRQVLNAGFAAAPVTMDAIELGGVASPTRSSPALVAFVRAISLGAGDVQTLTVYGPDGKVLATSTVPPLDRSKAQYQMFVGKKAEATWPAGTYRAVYTVTAVGQPVVRHELKTRLP